MISLRKRERQGANVQLQQTKETNIDKLLLHINTSVQESISQAPKKLKLAIQGIGDDYCDQVVASVPMAAKKSVKNVVTPSHSPLISKAIVGLSPKQLLLVSSVKIPVKQVMTKINSISNERGTMKDESDCSAIDDTIEDCLNVTFDDTPITFDENQWDEEMYLDLLQPFAISWLKRNSLADTTVLK
jgi:hypothetical protein